MTALLTGNLLVASSLVNDPIYSGGVCLIVHQDDTHVIGVMLNRPMKPSPEALLAMLGQTPTADPQQDQAEPNRLSSAPPQDSENTPDPSPLGMLHFGGPLSGPVVAIHQLAKYAEAETGSGIYVAAQKHHLEDLVRQKPGPYRLFVGHLGWEVDQLAVEIESGYWHLMPAEPESVFSSASGMWPSLIRRATSRSLARWIGTPDVIGAGELN